MKDEKKKTTPDINDALAAVGLATAAAGGWMFSPASTLLGVGMIIFLIGLVRSRG